MNSRNVGLGLLLCTSTLFTAPLQASNMGKAVIYEKTDTFKKEVHFTDSFQIDTAGTYKVTFTDLESPRPFRNSGVNVITGAEETLASLAGPGHALFEATPGDYFISLFAVAGGAWMSDENKREWFKEKRIELRDRWMSSLTPEELAAYRQQWKEESAEDKLLRKERLDERLEHIFEHRYGDHNRYCHWKDPGYGQYDVEIQYQGQTQAAVPVPAAIWLMGSGLLGLTAVGRRRATRRRH
jgi:hypothetical protein